MGILSAPMTEPQILAALHEVAREHLGFQGELTADAVLVETMRLDSLRLLTLVVEVENRFAVNLDEGDEAGLVTVGDLVTVLRSRLGG